LRLHKSKKIMRKVFLALFILTTNLSFSQFKDLKLRSLKNTPTVKASGSAYLNESFSPIIIKTDQDATIKVNGRYNAYNGDIEIVKPPSSRPLALDITDTNYEITFTNSGKIYKSYTYINENEKKESGFFVVTYRSNKTMSLYKKEKINFIPAIIAGASSYNGSQDAKFKRISDKYYYLKKDNTTNTLISFPKKKKELIKILSLETNKDISSFIKQNRIKLSKEKDIIKLLTYLNETDSAIIAN